MFGRFSYYFLLFEDLILWTAVSLVLVVAVLLVLMQDFSWARKRHLLVINLFFKMPKRYMVYLAANYIQLIYVLQTLVVRQEVHLVHLIFLTILGLIQAAGIRQTAESIRSFVGSVLLYVAFLVVDLLQTYIFDMKFDWRIAFVYGMLCIFLVLYSLYFFINSIKCLAERHLVQGVKPLKKKITLRKPEKPSRQKKKEDNVVLIDLDREALDEIDTISEADKDQEYDAEQSQGRE